MTSRKRRRFLQGREELQEAREKAGKGSSLRRDFEAGKERHGFSKLMSIRQTLLTAPLRAG